MSEIIGEALAQLIEVAAQAAYDAVHVSDLTWDQIGDGPRRRFRELAAPAVRVTIAAIGDPEERYA